MSKLKAVLMAAAALVAVGSAVGIALNQAGQSVGMTVDEWCDKIDAIRDKQAKEHFFVAVKDGAELPKQAGGYLLGDCSGGTCTIAPDAAPHCSYTYDYNCGPLVSGWRVCETYAHPYVLAGWLAADDDTNIRAYRGFRRVVDDCKANFTGAQCLELLEADKRCWLLDSPAKGSPICRYGSLLGSVEPDGSPTPCPYARVVSGFPCVVNRGAGSEWKPIEQPWGEDGGPQGDP